MISSRTMSLSPSSPFDFCLTGRIFSNGDPQIRKFEKGKFWQVIRLPSGPALLMVESMGTIDRPRLAVEIHSDHRILEAEATLAKTDVKYMFNLEFELESFYEQVTKDPVMAYVTKRLRGLQSPTTPTSFEALVDSIVEQQISLNVARKLEVRLIKAYGDPLHLEKYMYYAFPTPHQLASASVQKLRACSLTQRKAEYIHDVSAMIDEGRLDLEKLKTVESSERIIAELDNIRGVGVWTAEMTMLRGMQKLDAFPADDLGLRSIVSKYYCGHKKITSEDARKIASSWGTWKGLAAYYLVVASILGMEVNVLRSNQDGQK